MAETLAIVTGGLALAEVAIKAGGIVMKLRQLWSEIQDVPETISDLMEEMKVYDSLLADFEADFAPGQPTLSPLLFNGDAARMSSSHCHLALAELRKVVDELSVEIASSRRRRRALAGVKVVLKKEKLKALQKRLKRAVRLLNSAQLGYLT